MEELGAGNAQLPLPPMLMFDRITSVSEDGGEFGKGQIRAAAGEHHVLLAHLYHEARCRSA